MLEQLTEPELREYFTNLGTIIRAHLPPNTGFMILVTPMGDRSIAQYLGNIERADAAAWMRETLARWDSDDFVPRVGD